MGPMTTAAAIEIDGDAVPKHLALASSIVRIGRAKDSHVQVPNMHVSKAHAEIRFEDGRYHVVDVGSRAGIKVNRQRTVRRTLVDGDVIELGDESPVRITYRCAEHREPAQGRGATGADRGGMATLARFFELSRKLGGGASASDDVLRDVVDLAIELTDAERGVVLLLTDGQELAAHTARKAGKGDLAKDGLRVSETLVRRTMESGRARVVADVNDTAELLQQASIMSLELRSAVILPLVRPSGVEPATTLPNGVFGALYLDSRSRQGGFEGFDLDILERLAQDASSVVENARLLREAEEQRRIAQEVETARLVQAALIRDAFDSTAMFEVAGSCESCNELGGDFIDQFDLGGGRSALVVADVAGKGVAASLLAASLQGALAAEVGHGSPPDEIVRRVNRVHCRKAPPGLFITMVLLVLEADGSMWFVNAGHCPPVRVHAAGVRVHEAAGLALGLDDDATYEAHEIQLQRGDSLVVYSDGVVECEGPGRELYGDARLAALLTAQRGAQPDGMVAALRADLLAFRRGLPPNDDCSVLVVRRR
jgi:phosphoserine phosphatase RsbU/P